MGVCKKEGCKEWIYKDHDLCYEHYLETQPAYANDITAAVKQWLEYEGYNKIVTEKALGGGYGNDCIFDIIAAKTTKSETDPFEIIGIEVKSDHDTYNRLTQQLPHYVDIFDKVFLCIDNKKTPKHPLLGILRFQNGHIKVEKDANIMDKTVNILSGMEMEALLKTSGLHVKSSIAISEALRIVPNIKRKLVFNRFFGEMNWYSKEMKAPVKFNGRELDFLMKIGVDVDFKHLKSKVKMLKTGLSSIEKICDIVEQMNADYLEKVMKQSNLDEKQ